MATLKADGNKLVECGEEIIRLSNQYLGIVDELFDKISSISKAAWSGPSADNYIAKAMSDKYTFITYGNNLKSYGQVIKNIGDNFNTIVRKWENE